jgi:hypothetical protein
MKNLTLLADYAAMGLDDRDDDLRRNPGMHTAEEMKAIRDSMHKASRLINRIVHAKQRR